MKLQNHNCQYKLVKVVEYMKRRGNITAEIKDGIDVVKEAMKFGEVKYDKIIITYIQIN